MDNEWQPCLGSGRIVLYSSENKGTDQLRGHHTADLRLCFRIWRNRFSHDAAHFLFFNHS